MKTVVAPTDFSAISVNAVNYAADLACLIDADLFLIHVCPIPLAFSEVPVPESRIDDLVKDAAEKMKLLREDILNRTRERIHISTEVKQGNVVYEIAEYCRELNPYAVIMGKEGANAFERVLLGGKTISAIAQLSWPLIVVPPEARFESLRKIGLACDFRKVVETIPVQEISSLMKEFNAEFHVLHASTENGGSFDDEKIEESEWLRDILADLHPHYHFIRGTDIEKNINEFAEKNKLDLLIVIPKKHSLIHKLFQKSFSRKLVLHTHVPVMAVHE
jgi:nucleotide-binding universal stress UspA family protein